MVLLEHLKLILFSRRITLLSSILKCSLLYIIYEYYVPINYFLKRFRLLPYFVQDFFAMSDIRGGLILRSETDLPILDAIRFYY